MHRGKTRTSSKFMGIAVRRCHGSGGSGKMTRERRGDGVCPEEIPDGSIQAFNSLDVEESF